MAKDHEPPTAADYVVTALSPILIMGLVGSLAFFLLEILYAGQWTDRLRWTLFFFVIGAVLIGRISIQIGSAHAWGYGSVLGLVSFFAFGRFADAGMVANLIIIAIVLWSANKLAWDCTFVDETFDDPGSGLLEEIRDEIQTKPETADDLAASESASRKRPGRPMGRWVIYFSLAALPLFGLGQALIPADDSGRRHYAFWLMTIYVACGLGLLLTTTLLGLRRYLRQRKLHMPAAMTGLWLGIGAALIGAFLFIAALLPLSHPEYSLIPFHPAGSADRAASRFAMRSDAAGKGDGRAGGQGKSDDAKDGSGGRGQEGGKAAGQSGKPEGQGGDKPGGKGKSDSQSKAGGDPNGKQTGGGEKTDQSSQPPASQPPSPGVFTTLANVLKWVTLAILGLIIALVVIWFVARHLAAASDWARKLFEALSAFWRSLFGVAAPESDVVDEVVVVQERPRPFADFQNPFADGSAVGKSTDDLVRYSFAAFEAWAFEHEMPRQLDETPLEFADRIGTHVEGLGDDARALTGLYAQLAYARRHLPEASLGQIKAFWQALDGVSGLIHNPVPD